MSQRATITFVDGSAVPSVTVEELREQLIHYKEQTSLTGNQLEWNYAEAAFPYTIETKQGYEELGLILKGTEPIYHCILMGAGSRLDGEKVRHYVELLLPDAATSGDKSKANELSRYLAKSWKAELQLFNGRIMYFNPRK
ncbi:DUF1885 family protein [Paenibacillus sp. 1001270B_150601_E10]|uniref:DUF1885 family protein n=1 Tax=Paenibacillus sp. 1001270B_150601_E10 TaxID=2787079 RepID=UPI00189F70CC|nr:DUF1885 family protein [Paenibacillus sp. 1001270B_150601_E10]